MWLAFEQIFEDTGFFAEHGDHALDLLNGGEVLGG